MKVLMVQGTTSDAGKSTLVAGLCRVFSDLNVKTAPFKPQNMALNSAVTDDGGEIGRAQALQAVAARQKTRVDFNPILLKPNSDTGAQVIIHGKALSNMEADTYHDYKKVAMDAVLVSHQRLATEFDLLLVEGAGSPAEINLRENDLANMGYAEAVDCPVIIIADIDKGGVFAHLVGTLALLSETEQARVKGFVINRFRGDIALLQSGLDWLEDKTNKPVLGVLPYIHDLALDAEDAISIENKTGTVQLKIAVIVLPHISNHTDFDALRLHPNVDLQYVGIFESLPNCDLVILPGSKNVIGDLTHLKYNKWPAQINRHLRYGGKLLGICGGFQMLGHTIFDPNGVESSTPKTKGLALADFETELTESKTLTQIAGTSALHAVSFNGYEIHCGHSTGAALRQPAFYIDDYDKDKGIVKKPDGFVSDDNQIMGTYIHGLFDSPQISHLLFDWINPAHGIKAGFDLNRHREEQLDQLADSLRANLDMQKIQQIIGMTHESR
ncbi:cobyric acid synthase [Psychrosphaera sp. 1_MG-2023]|uniref:cobyric acid synthase n=1 Tax=Psychrosphaera sp. 1_MG-2023 TaxID=3062643 RepID=UPI0026E489D4|nr:cobyric acid synthase [Psychrosphaera sp. 1_MG-2023]MDO6720833.1 cobyric acid synthase [Psychrosphaera sp. 1_MG-2023]